MSPSPPPPAYSPSKLTPILAVDEIEPLLRFWRDRLGFEVTAQVPHEDRIGFVILARGPAEIMLQTHDSIRTDDDRMSQVIRPGTSIVFLEVDAIEKVERALEGVDLLIPRRETFYGATEVFVQAPDGTVVGFAQFGSGDPEG